MNTAPAEHAAVVNAGHSCRLHGHPWIVLADVPRDPDAEGDAYLECPHCLDVECDPILVRRFIEERTAI